MCNLYSQTSGQAAIRAAAAVMQDLTGNLAPTPALFPDSVVPIVRHDAEGVRTLATARWGMPSPVFALHGKKTDRGVTNIRNLASAHWRRWTAPPHRCLVPFTAFSEPGRRPDGVSEPVWFALSEDRPLAFFAGLWTPWTSVRKLAEGEVTCDLTGVLTTQANAEVGAVHPKAMPVILTRREELEIWLNASWPEAAALQRPLADGALQIVACGEKADPPHQAIQGRFL